MIRSLKIPSRGNTTKPRQPIVPGAFISRNAGAVRRLRIYRSPYFTAGPRRTWKRLADAGDLLYGFYNEDAIEAEFIHIRDGACVREYRAYGGEIEIDEGTFPAFEDWADVCAYIDKTLL